MSKKAFTLVEILVATTIFVMMVVVGLAILTSTSGSRSKITSMKNVQEAGRLTMEMMANGVKKADMSITQSGTGASLGITWYGFAIVDKDGNNPNPTNGQYEGPILRVFKPGNQRKSFKVVGPQVDAAGNCTSSTTQGCRVQVTDYQDGTPLRSSYLSSPDVDVVKLKFVGWHQITTPPEKQPYVTIEMTVQSRWQARVTERETITLKTTVVPYKPSGWRFE